MTPNRITPTATQQQMTMKTHINRKWLVVLSAVSFVTVLSAGAADKGQERNRFSLGPTFLFNVSAEFKHLTSPLAYGLDRNGENHEYDNGYVRRDDSWDPATGRNVGDQTWNWGVSDFTAISGSTLTLQSVRSPADGTTQDKSHDPLFGFETSYGRVLTEIKRGNASCLVGVRGAFGMAFLDIQNRTSISGMVTSVRDVYNLPAGVTVTPPYENPPGGYLLANDKPIRTEESISAIANEFGKLEGNLYGFKLGPFVEWPLSDSVSLQFQGGFAAMLVDGKFTWSEQINSAAPTSGNARKNQWRYGGFVGGQLNLKLTQHWSCFAGAGWQHVGNYSLQADSKAVDLKLDNVISAFCGASCSF